MSDGPAARLGSAAEEEMNELIDQLSELDDGDAPNTVTMGAAQDPGSKDAVSEIDELLSAIEEEDLDSNLQRTSDPGEGQPHRLNSATSYLSASQGGIQTANSKVMNADETYCQELDELEDELTTPSLGPQRPSLGPRVQNPLLQQQKPPSQKKNRPPSSLVAPRGVDMCCLAFSHLVTETAQGELQVVRVQHKAGWLDVVYAPSQPGSCLVTMASLQALQHQSHGQISVPPTPRLARNAAELAQGDVTFVKIQCHDWAAPRLCTTMESAAKMLLEAVTTLDGAHSFLVAMPLEPLWAAIDEAWQEFRRKVQTTLAVLQAPPPAGEKLGDMLTDMVGDALPGAIEGPPTVEKILAEQKILADDPIEEVLFQHLQDGIELQNGVGVDMVADLPEESSTKYKIRRVRAADLAQARKKWRRAYRMGEDCTELEEKYYEIEAELKVEQKAAVARHRQRVMQGHWICFIPGYSCFEGAAYDRVKAFRGHAGWQWLMLSINIINVLGLMLSETDEEKAKSDVFQSKVIAPLDMLANILFTIDLVLGMIVMGIRGYMSEKFNQLDFVIVVTGWIDAADLGFVDFSAFRVMRVFRPLRLIRFFKGIQAIIGSLVHGAGLIFNVITFMCFFLLVFGIFGVMQFQGKLRSRCVVSGPAPAGYVNMGAKASYLAPNTYLASTNDPYTNSLYVAAEVGSIGEIEMYCGDSGFQCPSNMVCSSSVGNPNEYVGFDNFIQAFILMFQVQTMSSWHLYGYYTADAIGWWTHFYYVGLLILVGFVVAQLFISVVCFGYDSLAEQMEMPVFSGVETSGGEVLSDEEDDEEELPVEGDTNLCGVCRKPAHPLDDVQYDILSLGYASGIRVEVLFRVQEYAPLPLGPGGKYPPNHNSAPGLSISKNSAIEPADEGSPDCSPTPLPGQPLEGSSKVEPITTVEGTDMIQPLEETRPEGPTPGELEEFDLTSPAASGSGPGSGSGSGTGSTEGVAAAWQPQTDGDRQTPPVTPDIGSPDLSAAKQAGLERKRRRTTVGEGRMSPGGTVKSAFNMYQDHVQQVKKEVAEAKEREKLAPFCAEALTEEPPVAEIGMHETLKLWSQQTIGALRQMLFEQEGLQKDQRVAFYRDDDETMKELGEEVTMQELLPSWPVVDSEGRLDPINIPFVRLQCRFKIQVVIDLLTHPDDFPICYYFDGNETIGDVEKLIARDVKDTIGLENRWINCYLDENHLDKDMSVWEACTNYIEDFSAMQHTATLVVALDSPEWFILHKSFDNLIMGTIAANTLFLAFEHYKQSASWDLAQEISGWVFNAVFIFEMCAKLFCLKGFCNYIRPASTKMDFIIVMSSIAQIMIDAVLADGAADLSILKLMRVIRALRIVRLFRKFKSVRDILNAALGSLTPMLNIMVFTMLLLVVFCCLGMQFYGRQFDDFEGGKPRQNFDDFLAAFYTLFQVLTGSAWEGPLYDCMASPKNGGFVGWFIITLFFLLSNYIVLNLFIGAILSNMDTDTDDDRLRETRNNKDERIAAQRRARSAQIFANSKYKAWKKNGGYGDLATMEEVMELGFARSTFEKSATPRRRFGIPVTNLVFLYFDPYNPIRRLAYNLATAKLFDQTILGTIIFSTFLLALDNPSTREQDVYISLFETCDMIFIVIFTFESAVKVFAFGFIWTDNVEFMLSDQETLKQFCLGSVGEPAYMYNPWNYLDIIVLMVSYLGLVGDPNGPLKILRLVRAFRPLRMINKIAGMKLIVTALATAGPSLVNVMALLVAVFAIFAILGLSLFMGKLQKCNDYDVAGKATCVGMMTSEQGNYMVPRIWSNPRVGLTAQQSFDNVFSSLMILFTIASGDSWEDVLYLLSDVASGEDENPRVDNARFYGMYVIFFVMVGQLFMIQLFVAVIINSFNFAEGTGLLTATQRLAKDLIKLAADCEPEPKPEPAQPLGCRLIAYDMFMDYNPLPVDGMDQSLEQGRVLNVAEMKRLDEGDYDRELRVLRKASEAEDGSEATLKEIVELEQKMEALKVDIAFANDFTEYNLAHQTRPEGWRFIMGEHFDSFITTSIIISVIFMCLSHYQQSDTWLQVQEIQNNIFFSIFLFEFLLKHVGLGFKSFWSNGFDILDGVVVLSSLLFLVVPGGQIAKLLRIGRVMRLIRRSPSLKVMMSSLISILGPISNVFSVLLLVFFVYAVIGVELFSGTRYGEALNGDNNFKTWSMAMLSLWRACNGDWIKTMYDTQVTFPSCTQAGTQFINNSHGDVEFKVNDCGTVYGVASPVISVVYHSLFQALSKYAVLNVVIAIILGAFTWCYSLEQSELTSNLPVTADNVRHFKAIWDRFDLYSTGRIDIEHLPLFLAVVQWNIPTLFSTGVYTQEDRLLFNDYVSFDRQAAAAGIAAESALERNCRRNYHELVARLGKFERSKELWLQLTAADCDVQMGCNDNVAGFEPSLHPLGSTLDADLHIFTKEINNEIIYVETYDVNATPPSCEVLQVTFSSLIQVLVMDPLNLTDHDLYVCYDNKDPFSYFVPGYFKDKIPLDGEICLNLDPNVIEPPAKQNSVADGTNEIWSPPSFPEEALRERIRAFAEPESSNDSGNKKDD